MRQGGVNQQKIAYEDRIILWARRRQEARILDAQLVEIALDTGADLPDPPAVAAATMPGDEQRLRGIPVVGVRGGFGGAIPGTKPGARLT